VRQVDTGRVDVAKQREALAREKAENEALFARQQAELAEQLEVSVRVGRGGRV
jgi:hypothetical protein